MTREREFYVLIGNRIKEYRKKKNLTQAELADRCGLKRTSITNVERGKQNPTIYGIAEICDALEIEFKDLLPNIGEIFSEKKVTKVEYVDIGGKSRAITKSMADVITKIKSDLQKNS